MTKISENIFQYSQILPKTVFTKYIQENPKLLANYNKRWQTNFPELARLIRQLQSATK
jgi:hypothetical protein